jgi:DNA repair photolyase
LGVYFSIPFDDYEIARALEPFAPSPNARFAAMKELADAGIQVGIGIAPTVPGLTTDIPRLLQRAKCCGATKAFINMLRLPGSVAPYFEQRLREKLPTKADRVLNRIREARGGKLNSSKFGERMRGKGQYWQAQEKLFNVYAKRLGFNEHRVGATIIQIVKPSAVLRPNGRCLVEGKSLCSAFQRDLKVLQLQR